MERRENIVRDLLDEEVAGLCLCGKERGGQDVLVVSCLCGSECVS